MIEVIEQQVPESKLDDILQWMGRVEADQFIGSLNDEIAKLVAQAANAALERPHYLLSNPQVINQQSEELLREAARLQMCVDVFQEKRIGKKNLISVTLKTS